MKEKVYGPNFDFNLYADRDFHVNPAKFEFGAKLSKSDFDS